MSTVEVSTPGLTYLRVTKIESLSRFGGFAASVDADKIQQQVWEWTLLRLSEGCALNVQSFLDGDGWKS